MAVIKVGEHYDREGSINSKFERIYRRSWLVQTDSKTTGRIAVRESVPVRIGNVFSCDGETDAGSFCNDISVKSLSGASAGKEWIVTATYGPYDPSTNASNPLERPIEVSGGFSEFEEIVDVDVDGNPVVNSAGEPFANPVMRDDPRPDLMIVTNAKTLDLNLIYTYRRAVNSDEFWGANPGQVRVASITWQYLHHADIGYYYKITYTFKFKKDGWQIRLQDKGMRVLNAGGTALEKVKFNGIPADEPVFLDGNGRAKALTADVVYLDFKRYEELPFSIFNVAPSQLPGDDS